MSAERKMNAWKWNEIGLKFNEISRIAIAETTARRHVRDDLSDETIDIHKTRLSHI